MSSVIQPVRTAQIAGLRAVTDVQDEVLKAIANRLSGAFRRGLSIGCGPDFERLALTGLFLDPHAQNELRRVLIDSVPFDVEDVLADVMADYPTHPVELTIEASQTQSLCRAEVRLCGDWTHRQAWEAMPRFGIGSQVATRYERTRGRLRVDQVLSVAVGIDPKGQYVEVEFDRRGPTSEVGEWSNQLWQTARYLQLPEANGLWLRDLLGKLVTGAEFTTPLAIRLRPGGMESSLRLTLPNVQPDLVLALCAELRPELAGVGLKLGACMAVIEADRVRKLHVDVGMSTPSLWIEAQG